MFSERFHSFDGPQRNRVWASSNRSEALHYCGSRDQRSAIAAAAAAAACDTPAQSNCRCGCCRLALWTAATAMAAEVSRARLSWRIICAARRAPAAVCGGSRMRKRDCKCCFLMLPAHGWPFFASSASRPKWRRKAVGCVAALQSGRKPTRISYARTRTSQIAPHPVQFVASLANHHRSAQDEFRVEIRVFQEEEASELKIPKRKTIKTVSVYGSNSNTDKHSQIEAPVREMRRLVSGAGRPSRQHKPSMGN